MQLPSDSGNRLCVKHMTEAAINDRFENGSVSDHTIFIFYDVEITSSKEIEQLVAFALPGEHFGTLIRATTRRTTRPILSKLSPTI